MPDLFNNEGKLNPDALKQLTGEEMTDNERYEMRWHGKRNAKRNAFTPSTATLKFDATRSVNAANSQNLIIEGDNLEVLKLLSTAYRDQVKMIYIDPPYNTGNDFVYSDNFTEDKQAYWQNAQVVAGGVKIDTNTESDGRYHSNWLNMMYSRLLIAKQLLRDDGVIFISIDDNEQANLKKLCDEVFGADNFEGHIHWRRRHNQPNDKTKMIGLVAEHILCYAKNSVEYKKSGVGKIDLTGDFSNPDNDPRGDWASKPWKVGSDQSGSKYAITNPNSGVVFDAEWMGEEDTYLRLFADNRIFFPRRGDGLPRKKYFRFEREEEGQCATNWWSHEEFGHNQGANDLMTELFGIKNIFSNPKPTKILRGLLQIANVRTNSLILDFFAGSGTTAQAVMELNLEDGGNRQYICVQLPELTDEKSPAYEAGYTKISDITIARASKVIDKLTLEQPDKVAALPSPMGFKVFQLTQSNFPSVTFAPDSNKSEAENLADLQQYMADKAAQLTLDFKPEHLITEVLIKQGFNLNYRVSDVAGFDNKILRVQDELKSALVCLDGTLHDSTVAYFKQHTDERFICLERAINTTQKYNLKLSLGERFCAF
jgi:adenine-specific DNA-methyltransferase